MFIDVSGSNRELTQYGGNGSRYRFDDFSAGRSTDIIDFACRFSSMDEAIFDSSFNKSLLKEAGFRMMIVIRGPSVGKSTLIHELRNAGFAIVPEQATEIIKEGKILPWENRDLFQREVLKRQIEAEAPNRKSKETVFVDRGIFDGEAYYQCCCSLCYGSCSCLSCSFQFIL